MPSPDSTTTRLAVKVLKVVSIALLLVVAARVANTVPNIVRILGSSPLYGVELLTAQIPVADIQEQTLTGAQTTQRNIIFEAEKRERDEVARKVKAQRVAFKTSLDAFYRAYVERTSVFLASGGPGGLPLIYPPYPKYIEDAEKAYLANALDALGRIGLGDPETTALVIGVYAPTDSQSSGESGKSKTLIGELLRRTRPGAFPLLKVANAMQEIESGKEEAKKTAEAERNTQDVKPVLDPLEQRTIITRETNVARGADQFPASRVSVDTQVDDQIDEAILSQGDNTIASKLQASSENGFIQFGRNLLEFLGVDQILNDLRTVPGQLIRQGINYTESRIEGALNDVISSLLNDDDDDNDGGGAGRSSSGATTLATGTRPAETLRSGQSGRSLFGGRAAAEARFSHFLEPALAGPGGFDLLNQLGQCSDPNNPGPDECVINDGLRTAISRELTVAEAIEQGLLNGDAPFGFDPNGVEPSYLEGYPFRSLLILRTYRIIPVTWEIAAQAVNRFSRGQTVSLNDLIENFDNNRNDDPRSAFYGLIDPDWVLKAPETICRGIAFGGQIESQKISRGRDNNNDGDFEDSDDLPPSLAVSRGEYCADYQSCIRQGPGGLCQTFGYCTEEQRVWNLGGDECPAYSNTCRVFQNRSGGVFGYLENSLTYNNCNSENAGCQWYCNEFNTVNDIWTCTDQDERVLKECEIIGGCTISASCNIDQGEFFCGDDFQDVDILLTSACTPGSRWWNGATCEVDSTCTIEKGAVACATTGCEALPNTLINPSFEQGGEPGQVAFGWSESDDDPTVYFAQTGAAHDRQHDGSQSIRFFSFGGAVNATLESNIINLEPNSDQTLAGFIHNRLNLGTIVMSATNADGLPLLVRDEAGSPLARRLSTVKRNWEELSVDFVTPPDGRVRVRIQVGDGIEQVSGTAWIDNFKIAQRCITQPTILSLIGNDFKDGSKLHFDRDVLQCQASADGCSEFYTTNQRLDENLFPNGDLALFDGRDDNPGLPDDGLPDDFNIERANSFIIPFANSVDLFAVTDPGRNDTAIKIEKRAQGECTNEDDKGDICTTAANCPNGKARACSTIDSGAIVNLAPLQPSGLTYGNRTYLVSFLAKASVGVSINDCANEAVGIYSGCLNNDLSNHVRYKSGGLIKSISMVGLSDSEWSRFFTTFTTDDIADAAELDLILRPPHEVGSYIIYDDIELIELDNEFEAANFTAPHPLAAEQLFLRKPPDSLECRGYTIERPSPFVLDGIQKDQCTDDNLLWTKVCIGGNNPGQACDNSSDCDTGQCVANNCDATGQFCCHELDSSECFNYALYCEADEVGCDSYTPLNTGPAIPAVAAFDDFCPLECVGYNAYKQSPSIFEGTQSLEFFIPSTANQCSASQAGCTQFTNLDEVAQGGEGVEYYQQLRLCIKPDDPTANCTNYFAWQGNDETGFQLTSYQLQADDTGAPERVVSIPTDIANIPDAWCGDKTLDANNLPACCNDPSDPLSNPFCKELLDIGSNIHYRLFDNTISCSTECLPLRKRNYGDEPSVAQSNCEDSHGVWQDGLCIYQATPSESVRCSAAASGCREYRGNSGANVFTALADDFEDGDTAGWRYGQISSTALTVGGHSIRSIDSLTPDGHIIETMFGDYGSICSINDVRCDDTTTNGCYNPARGKCTAAAVAPSPAFETCQVDVGEQFCSVVGSLLKPEANYLVSFWARGASQNIIPGVQVDMVSGAGGSEVFSIGTFNVGADWQNYVFGPFVPDELNNSSRLRFQIPNDNDIFVDTLVINEIQDYAYVLKSSWRTPVSCDTNPFLTPPQPAPQFMLGCAQYSDTLDRVNNLKSFTRLCREDAVGCQALIDTHNSNSFSAETFNRGDAVGETRVAADELAYITARSEFSCGAANQGCQQVGLPLIHPDGKVVSHETTFLINDPDTYEQTLCGSPEVFCEEFQTNQGFSYFKDPGLRVCDYRLSQETPNNQAGWYKTGSDELCPIERSPLGDLHPSDNWAGLCSAEFNGCTQYIDPTSTIGKNIVFNADFDQDFEPAGSAGHNIPDGWNSGIQAVCSISGEACSVDAECGEGEICSNNFIEQTLRVQPDTLYTFSFTNIVPAFSTTLLDSQVGRGFHAGIVDCPGVISFDASLTPRPFGICSLSRQDCLSDAECLGAGNDCNNIGGQIEIPQSAFVGDWTSVRPDLPQQRSFSGRFYVPANTPPDARCKIRFSHAATQGTGAGLDLRQIVDNQNGLIARAFVAQTGRYYTIDSSVDKFSCNGQVDQTQGCVLFNDRGSVNYHIRACIAGTFGASCEIDSDCDTFSEAGDGVCSNEVDNTYLQFDADVSGPGVNGGVPVSAAQGCGGNCDSGTVLNVRPDRQCGEWLSCSTTLKTRDINGVDRDFCIDLVQCNSFDENGNCDGFVQPDNQRVNEIAFETDEPSNLTAHRADNKQLGNLSGFSLAGMTANDIGGLGLSLQPFRDNNTIRGLYPYSQMRQGVEVSVVPNGGFENITAGTKPLGWQSATQADWDPAEFRVLNDVNDAQINGIRILDGNNVLALNAAAQVVSEEIEVRASGEYTLSVWFNTLRLQPADAEVIVFIEADKVIASGDGISLGAPYSLNDSGVGNRRVFALAKISARSDWVNIIKRFNVRPDVNTIKFWLVNWVAGDINSGGEQLCRDEVSLRQGCTIAGGSSDCFPGAPASACQDLGEGNVCVQDGICDVSGTAYVDRIELLPSLEVRDLPPFFDADSNPSDDSKTYVSRSCRAYPAGDAVSCEYFDNQSIFQKGVAGYCLVPDPNNSSICLQWWPVDLINGDLNGGFRGYDGRVPLYMCAQARDRSGSFIYDQNSSPPLEGELIDDHGHHSLIKTQNLAPVVGGVPIDVWQLTSVAVKVEGRTTAVDVQKKIIDSELVDCGIIDNGSCWTDGACYALPRDDVDWFSLVIRSNNNRVTGVCAYDYKAGEEFAHNPQMTIQATVSYCSVVEQVVTPTGQNKAWIDRIGENSAYQVHRLGYRQDQVSAPYGSIFPPAPLDDPTQWDGLTGAGKQPLYITLDTTAVHGGTPYSCIEFDFCKYPAHAFLPGTISIFAVTVADNPALNANSRLKRLFGRNYATWEWGGGSFCFAETGETSGFTDAACQCTDGGVCELKPINSGRFCGDDTVIGFVGHEECSTGDPDDGDGQCPNKTPDCRLVVIRNDDSGALTHNECDSDDDNCGYRCVDQEIFGGEGARSIGGDACCPKALDNGATGSGTCKQSITVDKTTCTGGDNDGASCTIVNSGTDNPECSDNLICKSKPGTEKRYNLITNPESVVESSWSLPYRICRNDDGAQTLNVRPTGFLGETGTTAVNTDYCGVAPEIPTMVFNGIDGNQISPIARLFNTSEVNIAFTIKVDPNQLPLRGYRIDWGDGNQDTVAGTTLPDRTNPSDPYILNHLYNYFDVLSKASSDDVYCSFEEKPLWWIENEARYFEGLPVQQLPPESCAMRPKVYAIDNWGFCTGEASRDLTGATRLDPDLPDNRVACSNRAAAFNPADGLIAESECQEFKSEDGLTISAGFPILAHGFSGIGCNISSNPHVWVPYNGVVIIQQTQF